MKSNKDTGHACHSKEDSLPCEYDCIHCHSAVPDYRSGKLKLICLDCEWFRYINVRIQNVPVV